MIGNYTEKWVCDLFDELIEDESLHIVQQARIPSVGITSKSPADIVIAAEKAGLKSGDIIVSFDGNKITGYNDLVSAINSHKAGDTVTVGIYRNGKESSLSVTLGSNG